MYTSVLFRRNETSRGLLFCTSLHHFSFGIFFSLLFIFLSHFSFLICKFLLVETYLLLTSSEKVLMKFFEVLFIFNLNFWKYTTSIVWQIECRALVGNYFPSDFWRIALSFSFRFWTHSDSWSVVYATCFSVSLQIFTSIT